MKHLYLNHIPCLFVLIGVFLGGHQVVQAQNTVTIDASYGNNGYVRTGFTVSGDNFSQFGTVTPRWMIMGQAVTLSNGKVITVGENARSWTVKCYLASGALDPSFGTGGTITTTFPGYDSGANGLAVQPDGKIVVVGGISGDIGRIWAAARYTAQGTLDPSFGTNGLAYPAPTSSRAPSELARVVVLPDGSLLAAAAYNRYSPTRLLKLSAAGQPDAAFGQGGFGPTYNTFFEDLIIQSDGKPLLAMAAYENNEQYARVVRLTATGQPDPTFGTNGAINIQGQSPLSPTPTATYIHNLAVQANGKIVLAGHVTTPSTMGSLGDSPMLLRLNADGSPDTDFNTATYNSIKVTGGLAAVVVQPDGKLLVGGSVYKSFDRDSRLMLARYTITGALDPTFATTTNYPAGVYAGQVGDGILVRSLNLLANGQLLAWEKETSSTNAWAMRLTRYTIPITLASRSASTADFHLTASPVPTSGPLTLHYTLPAAASVHVTLYDYLGRLATQTPTTWQPAGSHELPFGSKQLAPGTYVCVLEAGALRQTTRVVVAP